jgi:hypothetical protein
MNDVTKPATMRRFGREFNGEKTRKLESLYFFFLLEREWEGKSCISFFAPYLCHTCQRSGLHSNLKKTLRGSAEGTSNAGATLEMFPVQPP